MWHEAGPAWLRCATRPFSRARQEPEPPPPRGEAPPPPLSVRHDSRDYRPFRSGFRCGLWLCVADPDAVLVTALSFCFMCDVSGYIPRFTVIAYTEYARAFFVVGFALFLLFWGALAVSPLPWSLPYGSALVYGLRGLYFTAVTFCGDVFSVGAIEYR